MNWILFLNSFFMFVCWHAADMFEDEDGNRSAGWWLNIGASALNGVYVLEALL